MPKPARKKVTPRRMDERLKKATSKKKSPPPNISKPARRVRAPKAVLDGKTGEVIHTTVDGLKARVKVTETAKPAVEEEKKPKGITRMPPPLLEDAQLVVALQKGIDEKVIFGIKQPLTTSTTCEYEWFHVGTQQSVGCSAVAVFDFEASDTCEACQHTTRKASDKLCLTHMSLKIVGALEDRQTNLFDGNPPE